MLRITAFTKTFFTASTVTTAVDAATKKALSLAGGRIRLTARRSILKRASPSGAGSPPSSHTGLLKRNIYYGYEQQTRSLVVGPAKLNGVQFGGGVGTITTIPSLLEFGGVGTTVEKKRFEDGKRPAWANEFTKQWTRADYRRRETKHAITRLRGSQGPITLAVGSERPGDRPLLVQYRKRHATLAARPFMAPALQKNLSYIPSAFANSMK